MPSLSLCDSNFCPISLFRINKNLKDDVKNITCLLLRMVAFVRQCKLEDKMAEDILQISKFGFAA